MAINSFKLLKPGAIYRIVYRGNNATNPAPIIFVIYTGPIGNKVHSLVLNHPRWTISDTVNFVSFIRKMKKVNGVENFSGRVIYNILKTYYPKIVRFSYRTYFRYGVNQYALISTGYIPPELFTDLEKRLSSPSLYNQANTKMITKMITTFTGTGLNKNEMTKPRFYTPPTVTTTTSSTSSPEPSGDTTESSDSELEGY